MSETMGAEARESRECDVALDDEGYVLQLESTGHVTKCAVGGKAYGVAFKSTKHPVTGVAQANKQVAIVRAPKKAMVQYNLSNTDTDIVIGDWVSMKAAEATGQVKKHEGTVLSTDPTKAEVDAFHAEAEMIVGKALEGVVKPGAGNKIGKLEVLLTCPTFGLQE